MKVKFVVGYRTHKGQSLYVLGSLPSLGSWNTDSATSMNPGPGEQWELEVEENVLDGFQYHYLIKDENGQEVNREFGEPRHVVIGHDFHSVHLKDYWRPMLAIENNLLTAPFLKAFFKRKRNTPQSVTYQNEHNYIRFQIRAPRVGENYRIGVLGSIPELGNWDEDQVVLMNDEHFPVWYVDLPISGAVTPFEFKFVIYSDREQKVVTWESEHNRYFPLYDLTNNNKLIIHTEEAFRYPVGDWKAAGVAIPIFSLRTNNSAGVGEFADVKLMVDWAVKTGLKVVQVLPVNDTVATHTWVDSYPYAAVSVDALHPIYLSMSLMGKLKDKKAQARITRRAKELNELPEVDYEAVMTLKSEFYKLSFQENKTKFLQSKAFQSFFEANENWLPDYAAFCCLRDRFDTPDFTQWGEYEYMSDKELDKFVSARGSHYDEVAIHYYIQFHLDQQLQEATNYARSKGVVLKGDIPIGIYRNSVDAWRLPHLFNMKTQAGAPPDDFSITGQNWGFPTYNWEEMAKDNYSWWRERMVKMSDYFDVFRIDHILGFFRIWEIPWEQVEGLMGHFNPALPFSIDELSKWGIDFDEERFCRPYIREFMIYDLFGNHADDIVARYLTKTSGDSYSLKDPYSTQRKIKIHFDQLIEQQPESAEFNNWLRDNLYKLVGEVLFLEAPGSNGQAYNPRMSLHSTYSFKSLDEQTRARIDALYIAYYYHRHNEFWRESAMHKLPMLKDATDMLICGEDLGMVPASVPGVMNELQILSLAIQRMPNDDREFWNPADTPYLSVTSTGSHDMSTLREWWQEDSEQTKRFYRQILGQEGETPYYCEPWVARDIIYQHLKSPSMLAIFPIQDLLAMDGRLRRQHPEVERINVPAISQHYWKYRFHLCMEDLLEEEAFNGFLRQLIDQGGRKADY